MNLKLKRTTLINLSEDPEVLPDELTPQVGGGTTICTLTTTVTVLASHPAIGCGNGGGQDEPPPRQCPVPPPEGP
jgi:hypothetical protein